ncbi:MAG: trypsin-like peptidase domain-containing protein [Clostridia bacterium]|nr:trypsin-like peptidase domain-containing protein [Clostridia bacterium]
MGYRDAAEKYRADMFIAIEKNDRSAGRENAIAYATLLRQMAGMLDSYTDRAFLTREADKYEYIAAIITKWGRCDELFRALNDPAPHLKTKEEPKPEAPITSKSEPARGEEKPVAPKRRAAKSSAEPYAKAPAPSVAAAPKPAAPEAVTPPTPAISPSLGELIAGMSATSSPKKVTPPAPSAPSGGSEPAVSSSGIEWIADAMEKYIGSVWIVRTGHSSGTGFFISKDGLFLTNRHVAYENEAPEPNLWIESDDGKKRYPAKILHVNKTYDVALLQILGLIADVPALPLLHDFSTVRPGCDMMIIGNGLGYGLAPITGTVKYPKSKKGGDMIYTALTNNGDSGSPVLNRAGYVIGIHKSTTNAKIVGDTRIEAKGMSNATPVCEILKLLDGWGVKI